MKPSTGNQIGRTGLLLQDDELPGGAWGNLVKCMLLAASGFYGAGHLSRMAAYRTGLAKTRSLPCWTVSVGNLTAGGTGKTPVALALARTLSEQGHTIAVLSRGYGGLAKGPVTIVSDGTGLRIHPPDAADEACLLASRLPGIPVLTGPDRYTLGLHAIKEFGVEGVILDDGYQHVQLARDRNLLLLDAERPFGNGFLLPRGTLREPPGAVRRAEGILLTRAESPNPEAAERLRAEHPSLPVTVSRFVPEAAVDVESGEPVPLDEHPTFWVCGIARPADFFRLASDFGIQEAGRMVFPDHHRYTSGDVEEIHSRARAAGAGGILTTEKDGVKLRSVWRGGLSCRALRLGLEILSGSSHWETWKRPPDSGKTSSTG